MWDWEEGRAERIQCAPVASDCLLVYVEALDLNSRAGRYSNIH